MAQEGQQAEEDLPGLYANALVNWGNLLYERSQIKAALGDDWKPLLDEATAKFREAGCNEPDIRGALKNHYKAEELDLGPEPEVWQNAI